MQLKNAIEQINGLKFMTDTLNIRSSAGRRHLMSSRFVTRIDTLREMAEENELLFLKRNTAALASDFSLLETKLEQLRDIRTTLQHLSNKNVLDDIELFEVKHFAILATSIRVLIEKLSLPYTELPDLSEVISILDPEGKRIPHFHIYNQYSSELTEIRKKIQIASENEKENLLFEADKIETQIRQELSDKLYPYSEELKNALETLAHLDMALAKAEQAHKMNLSKPLFVEENTQLQGLFHPQVAEALAQQGKLFQRLDIDIPAQPTLITGANMAGKSVVLKSVALIQALAQFGFFVPAQSAEIVPVEHIFVSVGDGQDAMNGLSSFASEMLRLNEMVKSVNHGENVLVLIDELARTTNPVEGNAIVCGMLDFLIQKNVRSLITTHYTIHLPCRKLRVKGLIESALQGKIDTKNIQNYIDYSLEETTDNEVPHEALRIAEILGVNAELIDKMNTFAKRKIQSEK